MYTPIKLRYSIKRSKSSIKEFDSVSRHIYVMIFFDQMNLITKYDSVSEALVIIKILYKRDRMWRNTKPQQRTNCE